MKISKSLEFQSVTVDTTNQGIEVVKALYKKCRRKMSIFDFSIWDEIGYFLESTYSGTRLQNCISFFIFQKNFATQPKLRSIRFYISLGINQ